MHDMVRMNRAIGLGHKTFGLRIEMTIQCCCCGLWKGGRTSKRWMERCERVKHLDCKADCESCCTTLSTPRFVNTEYASSKWL